MSRNYRRRDPVLPQKQKVALSEAHIVWRLLAVGVAIVIAAVSFSRVIGQLTSVSAGWQEIEPNNPQTGIQTQLTLLYNIGTGSQAASAELRTVSAHYCDAIDHAYRVLSNIPVEHYVNLSTLNAAPNTEITVDDLLYGVLEQLVSSGSRYIYYGPLFGQYDGIYAGSEDAAAEKFDPYRSEPVAAYAAEIAAFARDPASVDIRLLGDNRVMLAVSEAYLAYAAENELDTFVDLGVLLNAFIVDAAADTLAEHGCTAGILTSADGYARVLDAFSCDAELWLPGGTHAATLQYTGPAGLAVLRSFPLSDTESYHVYEDGSITGPYVAADGYPRSANLSLTVLADTAAGAAIAALQAYAAEEFDPAPLEGLSWALQSDTGVLVFGDALTLK